MKSRVILSEKLEAIFVKAQIVDMFLDWEDLEGATYHLLKNSEGYTAVVELADGSIICGNHSFWRSLDACYRPRDDAQRAALEAA